MISIQDLDLIQEAENVAITAASLQSTAAPAGTTHVRICATGTCHVRFDGANPIATAASLLVPANAAGMVYRLPATYKVAVIQDAAATGNCNIAFLRR